MLEGKGIDIIAAQLTVEQNGMIFVV